MFKSIQLPNHQDGKSLRAKDGTESVAIVDTIATEEGTGVIAGYPRTAVAVLLWKPLPVSAITQIQKFISSADLPTVIAVSFVCRISPSGAFIIKPTVFISAKTEKVAGHGQSCAFPIIQNLLR